MSDNPATVPATPRSSVDALFLLTIFDHHGVRHDVVVDDREAHQIAQQLAWALDYSLETDQA